MLRFWIPISLVAAVGIIVSAAVGIRFYRQEIATEQSLLDRSVDAYTGLIQERLNEREVLARMAAAMFTAPAAIGRDPLAALRVPFHSLKADLVAVGWIPRVDAAQVDEALQALAANGMNPPRFVGPNCKPLDPHSITRPIYPVIDIEPRTPANLQVLGLDVAADPQSKGGDRGRIRGRGTICDRSASAAANAGASRRPIVRAGLPNRRAKTGRFRQLRLPARSVAGAHRRCLSVHDHLRRSGQPRWAPIVQRGGRRHPAGEYNQQSGE